MLAEGTAATFEEYLVGQKLLSPAELSKVEKFRRESGASLCSALRRASSLKSSVLARAIADYYGVPLLEDEGWVKDPPPVENLSRTFLRECKVFPLEENDGSISLIMEDPSDTQTINAVRLALDRQVNPCVASAEDIQTAIERSTKDRDTANVWQEAKAESNGNDIEQLRDMALGAPIVRYVDQLITDAVHARATDIHIEPFDSRLAVRMRVDGMLREAPSPPGQQAKAVVSRIKILSGLNIAERRLPQDGRARIRINERRLDLRVATVPTIHGEAVSIRLLDNVRRALDFSSLGFNTRDERIIRGHLSAPYGLILVTGPTGSGKTTTLATALSLLNQTHRKILTIEDPIEYEIDGINQTQTKPAIGLTFAAALRSFLRHDPDVLMVGEMRDGETAGIGIHAALTGHLVLSTLHTNTAAGAIPRLLDMGIDAFLLASSLRCVIGQRLVRVLCPHCKEPVPGARKAAASTSRSILEPSSLDAPEEWQAIGCGRCYGTGYSDRIVISEVLDVDEDVRELIQPNARTAAIEEIACKKGMTTMVMDGQRKCREGVTTPEEVRRVALDI